MGRALGGYAEPATPDPRDRADEGLQDARDDSDPGPDDGLVDGEYPESFVKAWDAGRDAWRDRFDTREEWEESR